MGFRLSGIVVVRVGFFLCSPMVVALVSVNDDAVAAAFVLHDAHDANTRHR